MNSKYKVLGECIDLIIDNRGKTPKKMGGDWSTEGVRTISAKNVHGGKLDNLDSIRFVSEEVYKKWMKEDIKRGDCLLASEGATLGENLYWNSDEKVVIGQRLYCIRTNNNILYSKYFAAYMNTHEYQKEIEGKATGTSVLGIKQTDLLKTKVLIKDIEEQRFIGDLYFEINEKIETNNKINKKLEEMAQAIFKQWFVDFEFPNEDGKPYKSSGGEMVESELGMIPKGWKVILLDEIVDTFNGYSYKGKELSESEDAMITIKNFDRNGGYKMDGLKEIVISDKVKPHHFVEVNDIIVAHTDLTQGAEIIGNPIMIFSKGSYEKLIMSMDTVKVKSKIKEMNNELLYFILKDYRFKQYALGYVNGTTVLHLSKSTIPQYKIALPYDKSIMNQLGDNLSPIMSKIANNFKENEKLIMLRDALLPKLMSGEIRVPMD